MRHNLMSLAAAGAILCAAAPTLIGAEPDIAITVLENWSNVFGGQRAEFHCTVTSGQSFEGRVGWSVAVGRRTIARGETPVTAGPRKAGSVAIQFDVPTVKEGVAMPAVLSISCYDAKAVAAVASLEKQLWIFPENPFANRSQWLKQLRIRLFDPVGKTRQVFQKAEIPFTETRNVDSLGALKEGILVIGEGTPLEEYRGLPQIMVETAAKGIPVLCLAPASGQFPVPGMTGLVGKTDLPTPSRIALRSADVIVELDKRLDARAWPPDGKVIASSMLVSGDRERSVDSRSSIAIGRQCPVVAQVFPGDLVWPWLEVGFSAKRGKLIVCGFGLVQKWNAGPTPRFLFARLLEYISADEEDTIPATRGEHSR